MDIPSEAITGTTIVIIVYAVYKVIQAMER